MSGLPDPQVHLDHLKDFQRRTVDYVFKRLYQDQPAAQRFLVADEVGLGKTMVAKGVIAKAIEHLSARGVERIDVVYICSNAAIAAQNLSRLNILPRDPKTRKAPQTSFATRLTLLPLHVGALDNNRVNFISFTPGTTFSLKSREGVMRERALLYFILREVEGVHRGGLKKLLQGPRCGKGSWRRERRMLTHDGTLKPDPKLVQKMRESVCQDRSLLGELLESAAFWRTRDDGKDAGGWRHENRRLSLVSRLRQRLSEVCLEALNPNLIILDEFQRFKDLLSENDTAALATRFFNHPGQPRVLLLSATPYKMYTVAGEVADDHYKDLLQTLSFLHHQRVEPVQAIQTALRRYRDALTRAVREVAADSPTRSQAESALLEARDQVQELLLRVMVRTERTASAAHRDAMVQEHQLPAPVQTTDLLQACAIDRLAQAAGARDVIEYWKSAPYLLNFMKSYQLKKRLNQYVPGAKQEQGPASDALCAAVEEAHPHMLDLDSLDTYQDIDPANARLRVLLGQLFGDELWRLLWLPPSLSYLEPSPAYARAQRASKALVFSSWNVVPDAIAAVSSYLAERAMVSTHTPPQSYRNLTTDRRGLLRFSVSGERYAGMGALLLQYPSPTLAALSDPLALARQAGAPLSPAQAEATVAARIQASIDALGIVPDQRHSHHDARWYWVAVALLDARQHPDALRFVRDKGDRGFSAIAKHAAGHEHDATGFEKVIARFAEHAQDPGPMGLPPTDLAEVLARVALGAPGVCALRALHRQVPNAELSHPDLLLGAARVGESARTLFNLPETMGLLGAFERHRASEDTEGDDDYWRRCVDHGIEGNLQAVLDEQAHVLRESLGLAGSDRAQNEVLDGIAAELSAALSVRTASLYAEDLQTTQDAQGQRWLVRKQDAFAFRTRFGLRLGDLKDQDKQVQRLDVVRKAFNSPFRPFLLASTSVGQEGLDFHTWCHVLYHWNLPGNPVDMEQREGRVHRYKGLAVRRNIARAYGDGVLQGRWPGTGDPWTWMFEQALMQRRQQAPELNDLVPFWLYHAVPDGDPARIERRIPLIPLSREAERYQDLKRSLVFYRLAFGQPRQEDLVHWLRSSLGREAEELVEGWRIGLGAPLIARQ